MNKLTNTQAKLNLQISIQIIHKQLEYIEFIIVDSSLSRTKASKAHYWLLLPRLEGTHLIVKNYKRTNDDPPPPPHTLKELLNWTIVLADIVATHILNSPCNSDHQRWIVWYVEHASTHNIANFTHVCPINWVSNTKNGMWTLNCCDFERCELRIIKFRFGCCDGIKAKHLLIFT